LENIHQVTFYNNNIPYSDMGRKETPKIRVRIGLAIGLGKM
jgi:hypothetical protein